VASEATVDAGRLAELRSARERFDQVLASAQRDLAQRRYLAAAVHAHIAAIHAVWQHPGRFVSPDLEQVLLEIGKNGVRWKPSTARRAPTSDPRAILHVLTHAAAIGGHTRMLWRWIQHDSTRQHSVALSRQGPQPVPQQLHTAVEQSGGAIRILNRQVGNLLDWAARLRECARGADLIVLHAHPDDPIPTLAFADKNGLPPVVLLDHADHLFWLGRAISDVVAAMRHSGQQLALQRRGIEARRSIILPTILEVPTRTLSRAEARAAVGLPADATVLLSIARESKYRALDGVGFADPLTSILQAYPHAYLVIVGPRPTDEWERAKQATDGRVLAFGPRFDAATFYQAADIYLDSFPFASTTSLLEAGSYGLPLVSRCEWPASAAVVCADTPGLESVLVRAADVSAYRAEVQRLIDDSARREALGERTRQSIIGSHTGSGWRTALDAVYRLAMDLPAVTPPSDPDLGEITELDLIWPSVFAGDGGFKEVVDEQLRGLPLPDRIALFVRDLTRTRRPRPRLLVPEWLTVRAGLLRAQNRNQPVR
jgi:glycosyltransferase involved in cell wall biosynthesis